MILWSHVHIHRALEPAARWQTCKIWKTLVFAKATRTATRTAQKGAPMSSICSLTVVFVLFPSHGCKLNLPCHKLMPIAKISNSRSLVKLLHRDRLVLIPSVKNFSRKIIEHCHMKYSPQFNVRNSILIPSFSKTTLARSSPTIRSATPMENPLSNSDTHEKHTWNRCFELKLVLIDVSNECIRGVDEWIVQPFRQFGEQLDVVNRLHFLRVFAIFVIIRWWHRAKHLGPKPINNDLQCCNEQQQKQATTRFLRQLVRQFCLINN